MGILGQVHPSLSEPFNVASDYVDDAEEYLPENVNEIIEENAKAVLDIADDIKEKLQESGTFIGDYLGEALNYIPDSDYVESLLNDGIDYVSPLVDKIAPE